MQHDQKQLNQIARDNPCWMFTGEEICVLCNVSQNVVSRVRDHADHPFFLNKCRPEWFLEWMRTHPEFQLTKADAPGSGPAAPPPKPRAIDQKAKPIRSKKFTFRKPRLKRRSIQKRKAR